jgi:hypothetical protein
VNAARVLLVVECSLRLGLAKLRSKALGPRDGLTIGHTAVGRLSYKNARTRTSTKEFYSRTSRTASKVMFSHAEAITLVL